MGQEKSSRLELQPQKNHFSKEIETKDNNFWPIMQTIWLLGRGNTRLVKIGSSLHDAYLHAKKSDIVKLWNVTHCFFAVDIEA